MTLLHKPEHGILRALEEHGVAHLHFRNEDGCQRFIEDNRKQIKSAHMHWSVDYEPLLTVIAAK